MTQPAKITVTIIVVVGLACVAIWAQFSSTVVQPITVTSDELEKYATEYLPASELERLSSDADQKKVWLEQLRKSLALGQIAEQEGYMTQGATKVRVELQQDGELARAYAKKHQDRVSAEEIASFHQANPGSFDTFVQLVGRDKFQAAPEAQRESIKRGFGEIKVTAQRARQQKLDQDPAVRLRLLIAKYDLLGNLYADDLRQAAEKTVTDQDIALTYRTRAGTGELDEVRARDILIRFGEGSTTETDTPASAKSDTAQKPLTKEEGRKKAEIVLQRVRAGEDFAKLAEQYSDDAGTKPKGGDLGYIARGQNVPAFETVAFSLTPGQVSEIVETDTGFHIVKVEDRRTPPLDSRMQQTIAASLKKERHDAAIERAVARAKVRMATEFNVTQNPAAAQPSVEPAVGGQR